MLGEISQTRDDDVVYARGSKPATDAAVIAQYPGRAVLLPGRWATVRDLSGSLMGEHSLALT
jgi:hypothetical protein